MLVWQEFVYGLILVLSIMFMPRGIWGAWLDRRGRRRRSAEQHVKPRSSDDRVVPPGDTSHRDGMDEVRA